MRDGEEGFQGLSDTTFEGIALSEGGRVLEVNKPFSEMFGYGASEVVGMPAMDFVAPESREAVTRHISTGSAEPYEAVALRKDGTTFDAEIRGRVPGTEVAPSGLPSCGTSRIASVPKESSGRFHGNDEGLRGTSRESTQREKLKAEMPTSGGASLSVLTWRSDPSRITLQRSHPHA